MKSRMLVLMNAITLVAALAIPARYARGQQQEADGAANTANPVPLINQPLVPDAARPGGAALTLTVNGTGFVSSSVVKWNGSVRATTFVSKSQLRAAILASDIATAHTSSVTVVNPGPGGGASNANFFAVTTPSSSIELSAPTGFNVGSEPVSVAVGNFNGDGKLDLAVANWNSNNVSVLLGKGDGTFQPAVNYGAGSNPSSVVVGDFNGDGKLDLAVANSNSNNVSVLLGNGDGTFQAAVDYPAGSGPGSVVVGDFNGDGKLDLAVANGNSNNVSVLLGKGDGTFQPAVNYGAGSNPFSVVVGDFNGDGKLDLVVANLDSDNISVLLGNGDGTFQPAMDYSAGSGPTSVAVGDFNRDGKLDLAVANQGSNNVSVLLGKGDGTFQPAVSYGAGSTPSSLVVGDVNGDGDLDLVVANYGDSSIQVLLGNGDGTFQSAVAWLAGGYPTSVAVGDFNNDGRLDIASSELNNAAISISSQIPAVSLSKTSLTFADEVIGTRSAAQTVTLTNTSGLTLTISSTSVTGTNATDFSQTNTCGSGLSPGAKCTIKVTFTPTQIGPRTASVIITDNAAGSPQEIALSGTGVVSGPNATLSTSGVTFATQLVGTTSPAQSVTLSNYGTVALTINSINLTGADPADFHQTNTCGSSVAPGAKCTISVTFEPTQRGSRTATLAVTDNAPVSPQTVSLNGTGTVVALNPGSLNFGIHHVGSTATQSTTLTNVGSTALSISSIAIAGADTNEFRQTNTCVTSLGAGKSCTIAVTFRPIERGSDSAEVSISDDGGGSPQQVPLSGAGCIYYLGHCKGAADLRSPVLQSALRANSVVALPRPSGSSPVGTRVMDLADSTRDDPFLADGTKRELLVRFWYPADLSQGCIPAEYTSPRVWDYFSKLSALPLPEVTTNSCLEAPITEGAHPVVVFTHGYTATFTDYSFIFEDLASRGYVVASVDHTYEATAVAFPDSRFVKSVLGSHIGNTWRMDDQSMSLALSVRSEDLNFIVNELERMNTTDSPFTGKLDTSRIGAMGHSLGGEAALSAIERDDRFRVGVLIDAVQTDTSPTGTDRAILILAAGREQWSESDCRFWDQLRGPRLAVNLRGAEHVTPSDLVWLAKGAVKTGPMGPEKTIAAVRDYTAAFLDANLRGEPAAHLLTAPSSEYPDAVVTTQEQSLCRKP